MGTATGQPRNQSLHSGLVHCKLAGPVRAEGLCWVLLAFSREITLGVDIETCRPLANKAGIAQRLFSREDVLELQQQNYDTRHFFALWTRHEACQKCQGEGVFGQPADLSRIGMSTCEPTPGVIASLAWMGHSTHPAIRAFRINPDYPTLTPSLKTSSPPWNAVASSTPNTTVEPRAIAILINLIRFSVA